MLLADPPSTPTAAPLPSPVAWFAPATSGFEFLTSWEALPSGEIAIYLNPWVPVEPEELTYRIRYLTWNGDSGDIMEVSGSRFEIIDNQSGQGIIAISEMMLDPAVRVHLIDLEGQAVRTYATQCNRGELPRIVGIGPEYLVVSCSRRDGGFLRFVPLGDPGAAFDVPEPGGVWRGRSLPDLTWIDSERIYIENDQMACVLRSTDPPMSWVHPEHCRSEEYAYGEISPDGKWVEVRSPDYDTPDQIAILPSACIAEDPSADCVPDWVEADFDFLDGWGGLLPGVWSPDGAGVYMQIWAPPPEEGKVRGPLQVWGLNREDSALRLVGTIPNPGRGLAAWTLVLPGGGTMWSPEQDEIMLLEDAANNRIVLKAFSVKTGAMRTLTEDGGYVVATLKRE
jgi:hypothetical protein